MSVFSDTNITSKLEWNTQIDEMLARRCDQAKCFEWMHAEANSLFDSRSRTIMIVSNLLSAVSGLSNVIVGSSTINGFQIAWIFGSLSIIVSIANMLQEKLAYTQSAIEHRQYASTWGVIRRKIEEEIALPPSSRIDCNTFLKYIQQDINKVSIDGAIKIPEFIRDSCLEKFSKIPNLDIPDICGDIEHTKIYIAPNSLIKPLLADN